MTRHDTSCVSQLIWLRQSIICLNMLVFLPLTTNRSIKKLFYSCYVSNNIETKTIMRFWTIWMQILTHSENHRCLSHNGKIKILKKSCFRQTSLLETFSSLRVECETTFNRLYSSITTKVTEMHKKGWHVNHFWCF